MEIFSQQNIGFRVYSKSRKTDILNPVGFGKNQFNIGIFILI